MGKVKEREGRGNLSVRTGVDVPAASLCDVWRTISDAAVIVVPWPGSSCAVKLWPERAIKYFLAVSSHFVSQMATSGFRKRENRWG